jgi:competence protein ComEC
VVLTVALVATGGVWSRALSPPAPGGLVVTMIDVGQGDALLVRAQGHAMLIDGGPDGGAIVRALAEHGVHRLDLLVMTHPHADHIEGLVPLATSFPVSRALDPMYEDDLPAYLRFKAVLAQRGIPRDRARAGTIYRLGEATVELLWPPATLMVGTPADINNNSIVLRVRYHQDVVLFAGEVQEEAMAELVGDPAALRAGVVKVSHHGSRHMLPEFYAATGARLALIPVGPNTFGHPAPDTLAALRGMEVERTDQDGTVTVALDGGGGLSVREEGG